MRQRSAQERGIFAGRPALADRGRPDLASAPMTDDQFRESRAALILLGVAVLSVLIFGAVTILTQLE